MTDNQGGYYTFYSNIGFDDEANLYGQLQGVEPPPVVTNEDFARATTNTINTQLQVPVPIEPVTTAQVLNQSIPEPSVPPPITQQEVLGGGIPLPDSPAPVTSADFNTNINNSTGAAVNDFSLNGDSNIAGGIASGAQSSNPNVGDKPGTGISAFSAFVPGATNVINNILGNFGNGRVPWNPLSINFPTVEKPVAEQACTHINQTDAEGRRVRLRPKPNGVKNVIGDSPILAPLNATNGMVWPYQPLITYNQDVDYKSMELTHANQDIYAYHRTPSLKLTVDGEFSVQSQSEGIYAMACIHFLRTVTKMHFGETDVRKGTPPPVLLFDAYGTYMFACLPVIVTSFLVGLPKDVDYVPIDMGNKSISSSATGSWQDLTTNYLGARSKGNVIWLPSVFNVQVSLTVQNSPSRLRKFNLDQFRNGSLVKQGGWV